MKLAQLDVVQVPAKDMTDDLEKALMDAVSRGGTINVSLPLLVRMWIVERFHFLGLHQWANLKEFDPASFRLLHTGAWACLICGRIK